MKNIPSSVVDNFNPHIGKNVIETLTLGMYEDARIIYREYVQNAADQIDIAVEEDILKRKSDGEINIIIDKGLRLISVHDNATGIEDKNVLNFLGDVANSQKDKDKRKGFRGIGRLGGLGYCERLIFETSYYGEEQRNTIILNAKLLKEIIENKADTSDAATVIATITKLEKGIALEQEHYFKVSLENVTNDTLLDIESVSDYLSMVAPIPFNDGFEWKDKIYGYYRKNKIAIDEYDINLNINSNFLTKPYKPIFFDRKNRIDSKILDVVCFDEVNEEGELIAIGWFGVTNKLNHQIPDVNIEAGIRLRKENIAIGNNFTLSRLFNQFRQNQNYVGEVHVIGTGFVPNARRDYFNDSKSTLDFENRLKTRFSKLGTLTQDSSQIRNRLEDIQKFEEAVEIYNIESQSGNLTSRQLEFEEEKIKKLKDKALSASRKLEKLKQKSNENEVLKIVYNNLVGSNDITIDSNRYNTSADPKTFTITLSKLNKEQKHIVQEIFDILKENLSLDQSELIKKRIAERYN